LIASGSLIGYDRDPSIIQALRAIGLQATRTDFGFRSDSDLAQLSALRAGLGVGVCQLPIAARDPKFLRVLPDFAHALEIWLVTHPNLRNLRRVRATLDGLAGGLAAAMVRSF
jgi:DNA-binding transcriptional LysR family regulator